MGRNRKKKNYYYSSGSLFALGNDAKPTDPDDPSIYKGGNRDEHGDIRDIITNIVFQPEYRHLSPEELRFQDHGFTAGYPYSYEEARWRHYLDTGRASLPKFGAQTPGSPFSISDSPQDGHRSSSSPPQTPNTVNDEKSTTSTCSLCAARLTLDSERHGAYEASTEGVVPLLDEVTPRGAGKGEPSRGTATPSHYKKTRSKKNRQRIRRLEKTVESLSHGLILALTELKSGALKLDPTSSGDRRARPDGLDVESDFGDEVDALSMAFTSLKTTRESRVGMCTELLRKAASAGAGTSVPPRQSTEGTRVGTTTTRQSPSLEPLTSVTAYPGTGSSTLGTFAPPTNSRTQQLDLPLPTSRTDRERGTHSISNRLESELPVITTKTMGSDKSLSTSNDRSPISGLLEPILRFMTCPDVFQFLKEAENHDGLKGTQMSDLSWVLDNLFDIHGGMMIHCLRQSLKHMNDISQSLGSNTWSQDLKLMQELDKAYSYCLELVFIFSERFPKSASVNFRDLAEGYKGFLDPIITTSYIEDLNSLWTQVHPALLEVNTHTHTHTPSPSFPPLLSFV
ncbi:hypothetical protein B0F90DRAFT_838067 [Multifurca ochricompacta]|uniref:Uncharacterized protein n=1 Tax=Multifurca ochricompacta TaxID=376703 RepID=A0AAD4M1K9_9AGAM|nr:hypothetical protein B0F90DRAFT_838067 [Multifurca ochricompacta]